jgi:hypothetical protein
VSRVQNDAVWCKYATSRSLLAALPDGDRFDAATVTAPSSDWIRRSSELARDKNEVFAWHCTSKAVLDIICATGADERVGSLGGRFGSAIYGAVDLRKADGYATPEPGTGLRYAVLARVLLGRVLDVGSAHQASLRRPPAGYDSIVGRAQPGAAQELCVYDRSCWYPVFAVAYTTS